MLCCAEKRKNPLRTNEEHGSIAVGVEESKTATTTHNILHHDAFTLLGVVMPRSVRIAPFAAVSPTSDALVTVSFARVPATYSCLGRGRPASADGMGATSPPSSCGAQSLTATPPDTWSHETPSGAGMCSGCDHASQHKMRMSRCRCGQTYSTSRRSGFSCHQNGCIDNTTKRAHHAV